MNKTIAFITINCGNETGENSIDLASALLFDDMPEMMKEIMSRLSQSNTTLYLPAMPSKIDSGDVASNFRYKHDAKMNNDVILKWLDVFEEYKKNESSNPIVITTVGRNDRYMSFKLMDDGSIRIFNNNDSTIYIHESRIMKEFLEASNITTEHMKKIRMSSEGARFNTYMADMIGFVNMMNWKYHRGMFIEYNTLMEPYIVTPFCTYYRQEVKGQFMLKPVTINGKEWVPKPGFNYMYFKQPSYKKTSVSQHFHTIQSGSMVKVYEQIFEALNDEDNGVKAMIRNYLKEMNTYSRLSDFWLNDIDDAFTILMIINAYRYAELDESDKMILEQFNNIAKVWYDELSE